MRYPGALPGHLPNGRARETGQSRGQRSASLREHRGRRAVAHRMPDCSHSVGPTSAPAQCAAPRKAGLVVGQPAAHLGEHGSARAWRTVTRWVMNRCAGQNCTSRLTIICSAQRSGVGSTSSTDRPVLGTTTSSRRRPSGCGHRARSRRPAGTGQWPVKRGLTMKGTGHLTCGRIGCPPRTPGRGSARSAPMVRGGFRRVPARRRRSGATPRQRTRCRR